MRKTKIDDMIDDMDAEGLVKVLINPEEGIIYKGTKNKPFIQILYNGCWFIQKNASTAKGLGEDKLDLLSQTLKKK